MSLLYCFNIFGGGTPLHFLYLAQPESGVCSRLRTEHLCWSRAMPVAPLLCSPDLWIMSKEGTVTLQLYLAEWITFEFSGLFEWM